MPPWAPTPPSGDSRSRLRPPRAAARRRLTPSRPRPTRTPTGRRRSPPTRAARCRGTTRPRSSSLRGGRPEWGLGGTYIPELGERFSGLPILSTDPALDARERRRRATPPRAAFGSASRQPDQLLGRSAQLSRVESTQAERSDPSFQGPVSLGEQERRTPCDDDERDFTLIELLVVIGIIGLVISLILVAAADGVRRAEERATQSLITKITTGVEDRIDALLNSQAPINQTHRYLAAINFTPDGTNYIPVGATTGSGSDERRAQVIAQFDYLRAELPDVFYLNNNTSDGDRLSQHLPAQLRRRALSLAGGGNDVPELRTSRWATCRSGCRSTSTTTWSPTRSTPRTPSPPPTRRHPSRGSSAPRSRRSAGSPRTSDTSQRAMTGSTTTATTKSTKWPRELPPGWRRPPSPPR